MSLSSLATTGGTALAGRTGRARVAPGVSPAHAQHGRAAYLLLLAASAIAISVPSPSPWSFGGQVAAAVIVARLLGRGLLEAGGGVLGGITAWLVRADFSGLPLWSQLAGVAASGICFLPLLTWRRAKGFPVLGIFGAIQGIYIYVGTLLAQPSLPFQVLYPLHVRDVGEVATLGYAALLVGAGTVGRRLPIVLPRVRHWTSTTREVSRPVAMFWRSVFLVLIGIAAAHLVPGGVAARLGALPQIIGLARIAGVALITALWLRGRLTGIQKLVLIGLVAADAAAGTTGQFSLYDAAGCAIAVLAVVAVERRTVAVWLLMAVIPLAIVLNAAKTEARASETASAQGPSSISTMAHDSLQQLLHPDRASLTTAADRFDDSELLGYVVVHVPKDYPYWNKQVYLQLPFLLVPRLIAPFKPAYTFANQFGRLYGLLAPNDFVTSANTPLQVEAWANFGAPGLAGIALVIGLLLGVAEGWFDPGRLDGFVLGVLVTYQVAAGVESGIQAFALIVAEVVIFIPVVRWAVGPASRTTTASAIGGHR